MRRRVREGRAKARVLPVPVRLRPIMSRPERAGEKHSAWTGVNEVICLEERTSITFWERPREVQ